MKHLTVPHSMCKTRLLFVRQKQSSLFCLSENGGAKKFYCVFPKTFVLGLILIPQKFTHPRIIFLSPLLYLSFSSSLLFSLPSLSSFLPFYIFLSPSLLLCLSFFSFYFSFCLSVSLFLCSNTLSISFSLLIKRSLFSQSLFLSVPSLCLSACLFVCPSLSVSQSFSFLSLYYLYLSLFVTLFLYRNLPFRAFSLFFYFCFSIHVSF